MKRLTKDLRNKLIVGLTCTCVGAVLSVTTGLATYAWRAHGATEVQAAEVRRIGADVGKISDKVDQLAVDVAAMRGRLDVKGAQARAQ